ncbi:hypothetical protein QAD02_001516 [Eretmocerus hayati]|uniref:Uncharacterized protein n=1 Tax=Eretmocerus hayati TaxID=131215 RepID=A0ACC2NJ46_9HYME|nr:hypothetical protein QAD02_001516 [Eretmocerus hayati]
MYKERKSVKTSNPEADVASTRALRDSASTTSSSLDMYYNITMSKANPLHLCIGYSYVDANGLMQTVSYTADAENGFRVHASNLPQAQIPLQQQDTPEVALAKRRHLDQLRRAQTSSSPTSSSSSTAWQQQPRAQARRAPPSSRSSFFRLSGDEARELSVPRAPRPGLLEFEGGIVTEPVSGFSTSSSSFHELPQVMVPVLRDQPTVYTLPLQFMLRSSMSHSQDELGRYEYSYQGDTSAKTESRALDGTTRGAYSYIDANGLLQQVHYVADENGFRVLATNLP